MRLMPLTLLRNIVAVSTGAAVGQVIAFAFSPIITRIYSPEAFGLQGVFLSLVSIFSPVIALRLPMAIVIARDDDESSRIAQLSMVVAAILASLLVVALAASGKTVMRALGAGDLGDLVWFLPIALIFVALQDVADFTAARSGAFRLVGTLTILQTVIANLARVFGGLIAPFAGVLVTVTSIAPALQSTMLFFGLNKLRVPLHRLTLHDGFALLKAHRDFAILRAPTDVIHAFSQAAPIFMLSILFSPAAAGLYALARSVVNLPLNIVGSAVGGVYYSHFADMKRNGQPLSQTVMRATLAQILIPGAGILLLSLFFPEIFAFIFGEAWRPAGAYARWMAIWVVGMLANIPSVRALPVIGAQGIHFIFNCLIALSGAFGMMAGYWIQETPLGAVAGYSIATAILYALQILAYLKVIANHDRI